MIFYGAPLSAPPDSLTIPQFFLDFHHRLRPIRRPEIPWLVDDLTGKSYGSEEIRARVQGLASSLSSKYRILCLFSPNHIDYPIVLWATHRLGAIITAANPTFSAEELVYQLTTTRAKIIVTHPGSEAVAREAGRTAGIPQDHILILAGDVSAAPSSFSRHSVDNHIADGLRDPQPFTERRLNSGEGKTKLAFLSFSSGTTGKPKAVAIPHYAVISNVLQMATFHRVADPTYTASQSMRRFQPGDVVAGDIYGLVVNLHYMLFNAMTVVLTAKFNYEEMLKNIVRYKISHLLLVPPQIVLFCKHPATQKYDLSSVRFVMVGAAPLSSELTLLFHNVLPQAEIGQGYGLTETCTTVTMTPISQPLGTPGSVGRLLPGVRAKVVKSDGTLAGYDESGELVVTGPQMTLRYPNNAQATKETYVDGWIRTGDEVLIKKNGDMFVVDRLKEIFKVKGFQVAPAELEGHLLDHPDVADAGVIGIPDDFSGEVPMAFIALSADASQTVKSNPRAAEQIKAALIKHVADAKTQYKWLAGGVEFIDVIPKNPSGKILRRFLRDRAKDILAQRKVGTAKL
ncbi:phenylacetyl-CoA ligase [Gautieria morchelliformis]|nr:phenylacetyl-CoA ligase [Gautieria morchelliformis]